MQAMISKLEAQFAGLSIGESSPLHSLTAHTRTAITCWTVMNPASLKALLALLPACLLLLGSAITFLRLKTVPPLLQLVGASALVAVVLTHICEALHLFPSMYWGQEHSVGHYIDLASAVLGFVLFPIGYVFQALRDRQLD